MGKYHHARPVQCHIGLLELGLIVARSRLLAWCAHAFDVCLVELQMFQQQLDVSRVWFIKNDGSTLAHSEIDQPIQNRALFDVTLSTTQFCSLLENHLALQLVKENIRKQDVVTNLSRVPCLCM